jgi:hypothetical protein
VPADPVLADYDRWLDRQALAARTRTSYRRWVRELVREHLATGDELEGFLATDGEHDRRAVLGDWRRRLVDRGLAPSTVNLALAAATSLLDSRALIAPRVPRVELDPPAPRALSAEQLRAVQRETDRVPSALLHHVDADRLGAAYRALNPRAATGSDGATLKRTRTWSGLRRTCLSHPAACSRCRSRGSSRPGRARRRRQTTPRRHRRDGGQPRDGRRAA